MGKAGSKLRLSKNVIFRQFDSDDGILLDIDTKNYFSCNSSACLILSALSTGADRPLILKRLKRRFDAPEKKLVSDLNDMLSFLKKEKMLA